MNIPVLYSDDYLLICEKPAGISSESPGLPDVVSDQVGYHVLPVHRLDHGTGGVIIQARSPRICSALQDLFFMNRIQKDYLAVVEGAPDEASGMYNDLLFHDRKNNKSYITKRIRKGVKKAQCQWELLGSSSYEGRTLSLIHIILHTGRTHQIRVQFGSRRFPLIGDSRYGCRIKADFPALWACRIIFPHPILDHRLISAVSVPPAVFPWNLFQTECYERFIRS